MNTNFKVFVILFLVFFVKSSCAQEKTITGKVTDESGLPLLGATTLIKKMFRTKAVIDNSSNY